jgi:hypothetical protein
MEIDVASLTQTCPVCPSQWEGRTTDGRWVYVRYRWGRLRIGVGETLDAAIDNEIFVRKLGDDLDGRLSYGELKAATHGAVRWPVE